VLYGLEDELLGSESVIWECTNCYACHERCPQQVKPVEIIISLKNMLAARGDAPDLVNKVIHTFETTGRTVPYSPAIDKQRAKFGLKPLGDVPMDEIHALLDSAPEGEAT
jgi:heterodisulfide reductase subunit C